MASITLSGSITPTVNVSHTVGTITSLGAIVFKVDLGAMQNGDEVELRVADQCVAGTVSAIYVAGYAHQQATQIKASPPVVVTARAFVQIKQVAGTGRSYPFEIVTL